MTQAAQQTAASTVDQIINETSATADVLLATEARKWTLEPRSSDDAWKTAERVHKAFKTTQDEAYARIIAGRPLEIGAIASMRGIRFIEGSPTIMADLVRAIMLSHPEKVEYFEPKGMPTDTECTYVGKRVGRPEQAFKFTLDMAVRAGLVDRGKDADAKKNNNYNKYPVNMLIARATTTLAKLIAPELLFGMGVTEVEEEDAEVRRRERESAEPTRPANAGTARDFRTELAALKSKIDGFPRMTVEEQKDLRDELNRWSSECPAELKAELKAHYDAVRAAKPNGAPPPSDPSASGSSATP